MKQPSIIFVTTISPSLNFFKGQLGYLKNYFNVIAVSSPDHHLNVISKREGILTFGIPMEREISLLSDFIALIRFFFLFIRIKPTIVHGNTPKGSLLSLLAAYILCVPVRIYMCHGLRYQSASGFKRKVLINIERLICFCATSVLCVSEGVKDTLQKDNICSSKTKVILNGSSNGINTSFFAPFSAQEKERIRKERDIPQSTFIFSFVGRIVADKGINELVGAFIRLSKKYSALQLHLIGDFDNGLNPIEDYTKQKIELNNQIVYCGPQNDVRSFIGVSDTLVLPSYREGFGVVLMEAGAMGIPIIASDIIGCNNVVQKENGILVKPKNEDDLYSKMETLYLDHLLYQQIQKQTTYSIRARFDQQMVWDAYKNEYLSYVH